LLNNELKKLQEGSVCGKIRSIILTYAWETDKAREASEQPLLVKSGIWYL
jgi:hypothetical protein